MSGGQRTMGRRLHWVLGLLALLLLALAGCNKGEETPPVPGKPSDLPASTKPKGMIGVSVLTLENPFFKDMGDAMVAEGKKNGYEVVVTSGEFDAARQKDQVNDFIAKKV